MAPKLGYVFIDNGCPHIIDGDGRLYDSASTRRDAEERGMPTGRYSFSGGVSSALARTELFLRGAVQVYFETDPERPRPEFQQWLPDERKDAPVANDWHQFAEHVFNGEDPDLEHLIQDTPAPGSVVFFTRKKDLDKPLTNGGYGLSRDGGYNVRKVDQLVATVYHSAGILKPLSWSQWDLLPRIRKLLTG